MELYWYILNHMILCNTIEHLRLGHLPLLPTVFPVTYNCLETMRDVFSSCLINHVKIDFSIFIQSSKSTWSIWWFGVTHLANYHGCCCQNLAIGILQIQSSPSDSPTSKHMGHCKASPNSCHRRIPRIPSVSIQCFISTNTQQLPLKTGLNMIIKWFLNKKKLHGSWATMGLNKNALRCSKD